MVNEFRINYTRMSNFVGKPSEGFASLSSLGFASGSGGQLGIYPLLPKFEGPPPMGFNNFGFGINGGTVAQSNNTYQLLDNFSKVVGLHTTKFGVDAHEDRITFFTYQLNNGAFGFNGQETGSDIADFLIGAPASYVQGQEYPLHTRSHYLGLYAQDSWRVFPNLVLNYGLRWDVSSPWKEENNQLETIVPGLQSKTFPGAPTGWVFPGDPGIPKTLAPTRYTILRPALGWPTLRTPKPV